MFLDSLNLKLESFGLDISDLSLKIVKLKKKRGTLKLVSFGETEIRPGIIEGGEIKDEEALSKIIEEAVLKVKGEKLRTKYAICSLPEEKAFLQVIQMPKMSDEELGKAIRFEAENYIPLPVEKVYLDFQKVKPFSDHLDHTDVLLVALPKNIVDPYVSCLKKSGLIPLALEVESQAISRALVKGEVTPFPISIIDLGATRASFVLFSGYSLHFTSLIYASFHKITQTLAQNFNIDFAAAEELKRKYGLETGVKIRFRKKPGDVKVEQETIEDKEIFNVMIPSVLELAEQIKNRLNYYQTHVSHEHLKIGKEDGNLGGVKKILLCGGGANLKELTHILSLELKIPVETGNPWVNILQDPLREVPEMPYLESLRYATAIGLALRGVNDNN
ncbi:MAG: type IV pilus assembly protein PilM [Patescibacteria group bacterium]